MEEEPQKREDRRGRDQVNQGKDSHFLPTQTSSNQIKSAWSFSPGTRATDFCEHSHILTNPLTLLTTKYYVARGTEGDWGVRI